LLSILLHPEFESNSYVYVYYTHAVSDGAQDEEQRINRYTWDGSSLVSGTTILTLPSTPGNNHNGGVMVFGPPGEAPADQKLFVVIGDLNRNGQLQNFETGPAPDDTGCILRINDDGTTPSGAEKGPFHDVAGGNASLERLYAYGVRNSFGIGFDPLTDILWNTENGPGTFDEINLVSPGFNSGWEDYMGPVGNSSPPGLADFSGAGFYSEPEFSWEQTVAPTFIHFLNGDGLGSRYQYDCFVGDSKGGNLYHFEMNPGRTGYVLDPPLDDLVINTGEDNSQILFGQGFSSIVQISTGPDGNLYVLSLYGPPIHRISAKETGVSAPPWQLY
jgi:glucose/arabinose dehydrogenase